MKLFLNDTTDTDEKQMCEVGKLLCVTSGVDNAKFANPANGTAGDLGFKIFKDYRYAPAFNSEGVGTLDSARYYSIVLKPVSSYISDPNTGSFMSGTLTHYSDPIQPTAASKSLIFDLPDLSEQKLVFDAGYVDGFGALYIHDLGRVWDDDIWVGYQIVNNNTGDVATITANTVDTVTFDVSINQAVGNAYHIVQPMTTGYEVYGIEMINAEDIQIATYVLQGLADVGDGTFELSTYISSGSVAVDNNFGPDQYYACTTADNKMIAGGGVILSGENAEVDAAGTTTVATTHSVAVTTTMSYATVPGTSGSLDQIMRYTFSDVSQYQTGIRIGSLATVSGATDAENDIDSLLIVGVADDGSWFEVINNGVNQAADSTMSLSFIRNVIIGTSEPTGDEIQFTIGMIGSQFSFDGESDSYRITWVDVLSNEAGIDREYIGLKYGEGIEEPRPSTSALLRIERCMYAQTVSDIIGSWSFSTWIKNNDAAKAPGYTVLFGNDALNNMARVSFDSDSILRITDIQSGDANGAWLAVSNQASSDILTTGEWSHLIVTYDNITGDVHAYIDCVELDNIISSSGAFSSHNILQADASLWLGAKNVNNTMEYADVRLFNKELDVIERASVQRGALVGSEENRWKLDEGIGELSIDSIGSGGDMEHYVQTSETTITPTAPATGLEWILYDWGLPVLSSDGEISIFRDIGLAWSDSNNPHIFRTENYTPIGDNIRALSLFNQQVILFCQNSVQAIPISGLGQLPHLLSDDVQCLAPHAIASTPVGVFFYDGTGISLTDGQQIIPVTAYRASDYLGYINNDSAINIRAVYDPQHRRVEFYFPYAGDELNNYGISISIDSLNCYPSQRLDVNAAWLDRNDQGEQVILHGTTNEIGDGTIWEHTLDGGTDGGHEQQLVGNIFSIDEPTDMLSVDFGEAIDVGTIIEAGDPVLYFPSVNGNYFQFKAVSVDLILGETTKYEIAVDPSIDMTEFAVDGSIIIGGIPFDYGVKWTDFASPQYHHNVRQLQMDVTGFNGIIFVAHYHDLINTPVYTTTHYVHEDATKLSSLNKAGDCFEYGFRVYGVSMTPFDIHSFEILFETEQ